MIFQVCDFGVLIVDVFKVVCQEVVECFKFEVLFVGVFCMVELFQDDLGGFVWMLDFDILVVLLELLFYQKKENWGVLEMFYWLVWVFVGNWEWFENILVNSCNIFGLILFGFCNCDDVCEICDLLCDNGLDVWVVVLFGVWL